MIWVNSNGRLGYEDRLTTRIGRQAVPLLLR